MLFRSRSRLLEQGARAYLTKPLDVRQLLTLIDNTLRKREDESLWVN